MQVNYFPVSSLLHFKVKNRSNKTKWEICSKLNIKVPEQCWWYCLSLFLTWNRFHTSVLSNCIVAIYCELQWPETTYNEQETTYNELKLPTMTKHKKRRLISLISALFKYVGVLIITVRKGLEQVQKHDSRNPQHLRTD